jgi:hypothetical protein
MFNHLFDAGFEPDKNLIAADEPPGSGLNLIDEPVGITTLCNMFTAVPNVLSALNLVCTDVSYTEPVSAKILSPLVPAVPDVPLVPEEPATPLVPEEPATPDVPLVPDEPATPDVPLVPDEPATPDVPLVPDEPATPDVPLVPELPDTPLLPEVPDVPLDPDTPDVPLVPEEPATPLVPDVPEVPFVIGTLFIKKEPDMFTCVFDICKGELPPKPSVMVCRLVVNPVFAS